MPEYPRHSFRSILSWPLRLHYGFGCYGLGYKNNINYPLLCWAELSPPFSFSFFSRIHRKFAFGEFMDSGSSHCLSIYSSLILPSATWSPQRVDTCWCWRIVLLSYFGFEFVLLMAFPNFNCYDFCALLTLRLYSLSWLAFSFRCRPHFLVGYYIPLARCWLVTRHKSLPSRP